MKRRCAFLDNCPGFNYNSGSSDYVVNAHGKREKNDTTQLGSTLMDTMIKEVGDFCDPFIRENWAMKPHHQVHVCYSYSKDAMDLGHNLPSPRAKPKDKVGLCAQSLKSRTRLRVLPQS